VAQRWLQSNHLSIETKTSCVMLMALIIGMQIPFLIYQGGLSGLQAHLRLNALQVAVALLRGVGAVVIMTWISPNVAWFFVWQAIASAIQLVGGRLLVINSIDSQADLKGEYRFDLMKPLWGFSLGVFGTTITGIVLMQLDKLVLSKVLSLEMFGYYSLAGVLASTPLMIGLPINASVYPRLAQLVTAKDTDNLRLLYHSSCQAISVAVIPLGLTIAAFSNEVMYLWTGSQLTANNTAAIVSFLSVGYTLMALMLIPYSLQLAHSWTRLGFYLNLLTIPIVVPLIVLLVKHFGAPGGAMVLILIYALQIFIMIHLMHKRLICHEKWKWYINDVGKPILTALLVIVLCRLAIPGGLSKYGLLLSLFTTWLATVCATALSEPLIRERLTYRRVINV
jgi:O-antigen/teichoic acid export membrane protein